MHTVAVLAVDHVIPFDLSTPIEVFTRTRLPDGRPGYRVRVCAEKPEIDAGAFTLRAPWGLDGFEGADTIFIPGTANPATPLSPAVTEALQAAARAGTRIASICTGAFALAGTGLLDGLRATTHWVAAAPMAAAYPLVEVDPDVLYVDNGQFLTSAGCRGRTGSVPAHDPPRLRFGSRRGRRPPIGDATGT